MTIKSGLPPIHPGDFLSEALESLGTSQADFARAVGVSPKIGRASCRERV